MNALSTLAGANREIVARHLVMAGQMIDVEPELAYQHAQAAVKRAGRVDVVREAAALTAYATQRYEEALREVRAVRRMRGDESLRAIEADSERGLGRPEKAIEIVNEADLSKTPLSEQVELVLVSAGSRADLEQLDAALLILDDAVYKLPETADAYMVGRLHSFRADVLRALGRDEEANEAEALVPEPEETIEILDLEEILDADVDNVRTSLRGSKGPLIEQHDGLILDLDGVCFEGTKPIDFVGESLTKASEEYVPLAFATNNALRTPEEVTEKLLGFGIPAKPENIMTSAMNLMHLLKEELEPGAKVLVIGSDALVHEVEKAGFQPLSEYEDGVVAVVQGYGRNVDWAALSEAAYALSNGARYYATNLDTTLPTEKGLALGNGSLVAAVTRATGRRPKSTGKPEPEIMERAAGLIESQKPLTVGDRLETDTAAAIAARMPTMHVLTGVSGAEDIIRAQKGLRPSYLALDLRDLFEEHPFAKHHRDGTWTAGNSQPVKLTRWGSPIFSDIELRDDGDPVTLSLDNYRAFAAAAWDQVDNDRPVRVPKLVIVPNDDPAGTVVAPNFVKDEDGNVLSADAELDEDGEEITAEAKDVQIVTDSDGGDDGTIQDDVAQVGTDLDGSDEAQAGGTGFSELETESDAAELSDAEVEVEVEDV
ncbi:MAG: HAD-IIA family hydrolase [Scrofimicrobium sp.]